MAFLSGIFGSSNAQPAATPAPAAPQPTGAGPASKQQAPANPGANPAAMISGDQQQQQQPAGGATGDGQKSALDAFAELLKPKQDPNAKAMPGLADPILAPLDPVKLQQSVANTNFAASIDPQVLQKAASGDAQALMEAINTASRDAFLTATQLSHQLSEHASREAATRLDGSLDRRIRSHQIRTQNIDNPVLQHPAAAPLVNAVKAQIAAANPSMPATEVTRKAEEYFLTFADQLTAPQRQAAQAAQEASSGERDFSYLFKD